jgi:KRAB domain-containing zinc finger protein
MCFNRAQYYKIHIETFHKTGKNTSDLDLNTGTKDCDENSTEDRIVHLNSDASNDDAVQIVDNNENSEIKEKIYKCRLCAIGFSQPGDFNRHIKMHLKNGVAMIPDESSSTQSKSPNGGAKHECSHCGMVFNKSSFYKLHIEKFHNVGDIQRGLFMCAHCNCQFLCKKTIKTHLLRFHSSHIMDKIEKKITNDPLPVTCSKCHHLCKNKRLLKRHILKKHAEKPDSKNKNVNATYTCKICENTYFNLAALKVHIDVHINNNKENGIEETKKYECQICYKKFSTIIGLNHHTETHIKKGESIPNRFDKSNFPGEGIEHECAPCGMGFRSHFGIRLHNKKYHPDVNILDFHFGSDPNKKFSCAICLGTFTTKPGIHKHMLSYHRTEQCERKHFCSVCNAGFEQYKLLKLHMMEHLKKGETNLRVTEASAVCTMCSMQFKTKFLLRQHIKEVHNVNINDFQTTDDEFLKFICTHCNLKFINDVLLRQHMLNIHSKLVRCYCTYPNCNRDFISKAHLSGHEFKVHNNMCCTVCSKSFSRNDDYRRHLKAVHEKKRDLLCPLCGKWYVLTHFSLYFNVNFMT